jgi:hypothetical protein
VCSSDLSNQKLADWAANVRTGGQDYSVVYIAPGEWLLGLNLFSGNSTEAASRCLIDCSLTGTQKILGAPQSKLIFNYNVYTSELNQITVIYGGGGDDFSITDLNIEVFGSASHHVIWGFYLCNNLENCACTASNYTPGGGVNCFYLCRKLTNCKGSVDFYNTFDYSFSSCTDLANCFGGEFFSCRTGIGCTGTEFNYCYMEKSKGTTPWANTAAGGWNLTQ